MEKIAAKELRAWFKESKRELPWRENRTPYRVWISEMMLQQTRVEVVIPYFQRWLKRFPDLTSLAEANLEEVIKQWEGLGYYSRARNLHKGARYLMNNYGGRFPEREGDLLQIPGIGTYTAGAIVSFAYKQRGFAIDGNVKRVLARYYLIEESIDSGAGTAKVLDKIERFLPLQEAHEVMEGLIELGALICAKTPKCGVCPLRKGCLALKRGVAADLPKKRKRAETINITRHVTVIESNGMYLLMKNTEGLMKDLYQFPFFEENVEENLQQMVGDIEFVRHLEDEKQTFTKYRVRLFPTLWKAEKLIEIPHYQWIERERLIKLSFCSGHRKIATQILLSR